MKYIYIYNNNAGCDISSITEEDFINNNYIVHSKEISKKTINKEKSNNKYLHIFKKHTINGFNIWKYYTSYCI